MTCREILKLRTKRISLVALSAIIFSLGLNAKKAYAESTGDIQLKIANIQSSLIGFPLGASDATTVAMMNIVKAGGGSTASYELAAEQLIARPEFIYKMKGFFAPWMNLQLSMSGVPWSKAMLFLVQRAISQRDISDIFTANVSCLVSVNGVATEPNTLTDAQIQAAFNAAVAAGKPAVSAIVCSAGQSAYAKNSNTAGTKLAATQVAGFITLGDPGSFWSTTMSGGTANRVFYQATQAIMGSASGININNFRSTTYAGSYAPKYVSRTDYTDFETTCLTCHGGLMTQVTTVFCNGFDSDANTGQLTYNGGTSIGTSKCAGSNASQQQNPPYPAGNVMNSNTFTDLLPASIAGTVGDTQVGFSGPGINAFGTWLSNIPAVYENLVLMAYMGPNGVAQGIDPNNFGYAQNLTLLTAATGPKDVAKMLAHVAADGVAYGK